jgi:hypothetical protein
MYQAVYKCRLCSGITCSGYVDNCDSVITHEIFNIYNEDHENNAMNFHPHKHTTHHCPDGSIGVADFQGFKNMDYHDETLGRATFEKVGD